jgi:hypothetical protein
MGSEDAELQAYPTSAVCRAAEQEEKSLRGGASQRFRNF